MYIIILPWLNVFVKKNYKKIKRKQHTKPHQTLKASIVYNFVYLHCHFFYFMFCMDHLMQIFFTFLLKISLLGIFFHSIPHSTHVLFFQIMRFCHRCY